jgi:hypothetical protein
LPLLESSTLRLLYRQFEPAFIALNALLAIICLVHGRFFGPGPTALSVSVMLSTGTLALLDAINAPQKAKIVMTGLAAALLAVQGCAYLWNGSALFQEGGRRRIFGHFYASSLYMGRVMTLFVFSLRYLTTLVFRPNIYVVLYDPLLRTERAHTMVMTLREMSLAPTGGSRGPAGKRGPRQGR